MDYDSDIVICGGGLNGCTLALALSQAGMTVTIVDRLAAETRADPAFDGRSYALALASTRALGALGLWEGLAPTAGPILEVKASDGRAGEGPSPNFLHFHQADLGEGPLGHLVEDRHLRPALLAAISQAAGVTHLPEDEVTRQEATPGGVTVTLASGKNISARLLVGADGKFSATAGRAGIGYEVTDYDQDALVCAVAHEKPHQGIAHQFFMPGGPLAILPLAGNRSAIVWSEQRAKAQQLVAADDETFLQALRPCFGSFLGEISLAGQRSSYPLTRRIAKRTTGVRLVLVGDAAQSVHPIAGQGLNQGLRDVATLAQVLAEAKRRGEDIGAWDVLDRHRQWRSFDRSTLSLATDGFNRLFSNDNPLLRLGRDLGLAAAGALPGLRLKLMSEAAGLSGELPRLLQGRSV